MSLTITEYRCKLINLILCARCEEDVKRFINASIKGLKQCKLNGHLILRFVEKTAQDLDAFLPGNKDGQQWSNIRSARMQLVQLKDAMQGPAQAGKVGEPAMAKRPDEE